MKIGLVLPSLYAARRFRDRIFAPKELFSELTNALVRRGHDVHVYTSEGVDTDVVPKGGDSELEKRYVPSAWDLGVQSTGRDSLTKLRDLYEYEATVMRQAVLDANKRKLDVLHVYMAEVAHHFAPFAKMPVVFTVHDPVWPRRTLEHWLFKVFSSHNYINISRSQAGFYKAEFEFPNSSVVHHGVDLDDFKFSLRPRGNYMVFMGRYLRKKGVTEAIQVALTLKKELKMASSKNYKQWRFYKTQVQPHVKSPYVTQVGFVNPVGRSALLRNAKVFLFPIKWPEPFGMVMIEAMACGTPVVAFSEGSVPEVIKDGKTGFIVDRVRGGRRRGSYVVKKTGMVGFREAVRRIYEMSDDDYSAMRQACRDHVEKYFTIERMAENHEKVYHRLLDKKR